MVGATVVGATVVGAIVVGATVVGATVVGATVVGGMVVGATVVGAIVVGATVVGATVVGATVVGATVVGVTVVGATVVGVTVVGATVVGATVVGVTVVGGMVVGATVVGAIVVGAGAMVGPSLGATTSISRPNFLLSSSPLFTVSMLTTKVLRAFRDFLVTSNTSPAFSVATLFIVKRWHLFNAPSPMAIIPTLSISSSSRSITSGRAPSAIITSSRTGISRREKDRAVLRKNFGMLSFFSFPQLLI